MPSPFPGMDPWLEDPQGWTGVHTRLVTVLGDALVAALKPRYEVRIEERIYVDHDPPEPMRADVALTEGTRRGRPQAAQGTSASPVIVPTVMGEEIRERFLTICSRDGEVVTVIEVLSPTNKRAKGSDGRQEYLAKRERVLRSTAHLVEIDLLRAGERVPMARPLPPASYYVVVSRAQRRPRCEVYPIQLRDRLPPVAVPLLGDEEVEVDLQTILDTVYDRAGYDAYLDHGRPLPPPPLDPDDEAWMREALARGPAR
ncbi:MAG: DUF4058 family protein [Planctomycetes bacterium]|nr:DUF4058 family protein [Planctomycetota bacterium]